MQMLIFPNDKGIHVGTNHKKVRKVLKMDRFTLNMLNNLVITSHSIHVCHSICWVYSL